MDKQIRNIKQIAKILNIGLDSIVFVDDSPTEIEEVKSVLPEVVTICYKRNMTYEPFSCFNLRHDVNIIDIKKRTETYRTNSFREEFRKKYNDYSNYIKDLNIKMDIHEALPTEYSRISELTQRTNKCTNGKRYSVANLKERVLLDNVKLYAFFVSDRFSDLGLVGAIEVEGTTLTLFSVSCRALGREIENKMLDYIHKRHQIKKIEYYSTSKNENVKTFLADKFPEASLSIF